MINSKFTVGVTSHLDLSILGQLNSPTGLFRGPMDLARTSFIFFLFFKIYISYVCYNSSARGNQSIVSNLCPIFNGERQGTQGNYRGYYGSHLFDNSRSLMVSKLQPCSIYGVTSTFLILHINTLLPSRISSDCFPCLRGSLKLRCSQIIACNKCFRHHRSYRPGKLLCIIIRS
ncbi:hypothetical protein C8Q69DRAFT_476284 [Paecilomyces variotii]|uniref:Uncharacterized protein n=1 Tax=Byssochlamys spectabilis TaxID=264951 RepID=A0A443HNM2_BYSSP|nr:hypothetical protein C8Q69DRAFT_476284 [Paecilomyces variotii]RWQ93418.1 hypothetical protein C8Q69DRAFT_476284 [Paecilomyces variotii]